MIRLALDRDPTDERLQLLRFLLTDHDWRCESPVRKVLQGLLQSPPVCSEASWLSLAEETAAYLAFRKQGDMLARACGCRRALLHFTRSEWEASRASGIALRPLAARPAHPGAKTTMAEPKAITRSHFCPEKESA